MSFAKWRPFCTVFDVYDVDVLHHRQFTDEPRWRHFKHDDVIKWRHFPRYWPFVRGTHRSPVNSPHKGQWRGALKFSLIRVWINGWVNNREAGDLRRNRAHYDVIVMKLWAHSVLKGVQCWGSVGQIILTSDLIAHYLLQCGIFDFLHQGPLSI